ncbi:OmpA family protein [Aquimonas voraii]|uniref:OmpA family protein n=1 Tax=Aquimonas voraii TaxID=265719 RepID=A0A1G6Y7A2_9GAMM|nr:OmpA family protein [Aquimonas voraii]SDD86151.1 OmpA family protein [Aquimonas voraii]
MSRLALVLIGLVLALPLKAQRPDPELELQRLQGELAELEAEPSLVGRARLEMELARVAVQAVAQASRRNRPQAEYAAARRIEIARAVAETEMLADQLVQLERERDAILLEASRRDAEQLRREVERLRLQNLTRAEETERALEEAQAARLDSEISAAQAEQARRLAEAQALEAQLSRREAELAAAAADSLRMQLQGMTARSEARGQVMTISGEAFASGQSALRAEARDNLQKVIDLINANPGASVLIEGHTDSQGSANLNQVLSQRRAEAVRDALIQKGVDGSRLRALGLGEDRPVADNGSAEGRARNRRVEVVVEKL